MKTIRTFLAVNVYLDVANRVYDASRELMDAVPDPRGLSWVPPQNYHVTMRFLGDITEPMIQAIKDELAPVAREVAPVTYALRGFGLLPQAAPRVVYAVVDRGADAVTALHDEVSRVLGEQGFKADGHFVPHVTVARIKRAAPDAVAAAVAGFSDREFGETVADALLCYSSELAAAGANYRLLWKLPLAGKEMPLPSEDRPQTADSEVHEQEEGA